jgi:hypothetical protein
MGQFVLACRVVLSLLHILRLVFKNASNLIIMVYVRLYVIVPWMFVCFEICLPDFLFHVNAWLYWKQYLVTTAQFHHVYCLPQFLHLDIRYIGSSLSFSTARILEQHLSWNSFISTSPGHHLLFTSFGDRVTRLPHFSNCSDRIRKPIFYCHSEWWRAQEDGPATI